MAHPYSLCCRNKTAHDGFISSAACTDNFIFTGAGTLNSHLKIWCIDKSDVSLVATSTACVGAITCLRLLNLPSTNDARLIGVTNMSYVYVWNVATDRILKSSTSENFSPILVIEPQLHGECLKVDCLQDGKTLICAGATPGKGIFFLDIETGQKIAEFSSIIVTGTRLSQNQRQVENILMWQFTALKVDDLTAPRYDTSWLADGRWAAVTDSLGNAAFIFVQTSLLAQIHRSFSEKGVPVELTQTDFPYMATLQAFERSIEISDVAWRPRNQNSRSVCVSLSGSCGFVCTCFITPTNRKTFSVTSNAIKVVPGFANGSLSCLVYGYDEANMPIIVAGVNLLSLRRFLERNMNADATDADAAKNPPDANGIDLGGSHNESTSRNFFLIRCQLTSERKEQFATIDSFTGAVTGICVSPKRGVITGVGLDGGLSVFRRHVPNNRRHDPAKRKRDSRRAKEGHDDKRSSKIVKSKEHAEAQTLVNEESDILADAVDLIVDTGGSKCGDHKDLLNSKRLTDSEMYDGTTGDLAKEGMDYHNERDIDDLFEELDDDNRVVGTSSSPRVGSTASDTKRLTDAGGEEGTVQVPTLGNGVEGCSSDDTRDNHVVVSTLYSPACEPQTEYSPNANSSLAHVGEHDNQIVRSPQNDS